MPASNLSVFCLLAIMCWLQSIISCHSEAIPVGPRTTHVPSITCLSHSRGDELAAFGSQYAAVWEIFWIFGRLWALFSGSHCSSSVLLCLRVCKQPSYCYLTTQYLTFCYCPERGKKFHPFPQLPTELISIPIQFHFHPYPTYPLLQNVYFSHRRLRNDL